MKVIHEKQDLLLRVITSSEANILAKLYDLEGMVTWGQRSVQFAQEDQGEKEHLYGGLVKEVEKKKEYEKVVDEEEDKEEEKVVEEEEKVMEEEEKVMEEEEEKAVEEEEKEKEKEKEAKIEEQVAAEEEGKVDELPPTNFVGMQFHRKRRSKKPKNLEDFTDPSGKLIKLQDPVKVNPLAQIDDELQKQLNKWMRLSSKKGPKMIDVKTGLADKSFFQRLLKTSEWLTDAELDAACFLLRERIARFPRTYGKKSTIGGYQIGWRFEVQYAAFCEDRDAYIFDEGFLEYYWGSEDSLC